jgi:hypothetical protein
MVRKGPAVSILRYHNATSTDSSRWSFGGNRLQIKAETHVLADVQRELDFTGKVTTAADIGSKLKAKQDLLSLLVSNELTRLTVWLFPLDSGKKHHFAPGRHNNILPDVSTRHNSRGMYAYPCRLLSPHTLRRPGQRILRLLCTFSNASNLSVSIPR